MFFIISLQFEIKLVCSLSADLHNLGIMHLLMLYLHSQIDVQSGFLPWNSPSNERCPWMNTGRSPVQPKLFASSFLLLSSSHIVQRTSQTNLNNKNSLGAQCHSCSPNSKFCSCLPPWSCWKCNIPNQWCLPSFLQSSVWFCFSVTLGKPRNETLHSFHFFSFSSERTRSSLALLVRAVVLIFE